MIRGTILKIGELAMRYGPASQLALLDGTSSRRSMVMRALPPLVAITTEYQDDSSSKRLTARRCRHLIERRRAGLFLRQRERDIFARHVVPPQCDDDELSTVDHVGHRGGSRATRKPDLAYDVTRQLVVGA